MTGTDEKDRKMILGHIHSIFKAFLDRDRHTIKKLHADDWVGFMGPSTAIERGIDAYMVNVDKSLDNFTGTGYEILDSEIQLYGDLGIVYYVARYDYKDEIGELHSIPLRSVDIYRRNSGDWIQVGSHITVIPSSGAWGENEKE